MKRITHKLHKIRSHLQMNCWKLGHKIVADKKHKSLKNFCRKYNYRLVKDYL